MDGSHLIGRIRVSLVALLVRVVALCKHSGVCGVCACVVGSYLHRIGQTRKECNTHTSERMSTLHCTADGGLTADPPCASPRSRSLPRLGPLVLAAELVFDGGDSLLLRHQRVFLGHAQQLQELAVLVERTTRVE